MTLSLFTDKEFADMQDEYADAVISGDVWEWSQKYILQLMSELRRFRAEPIQAREKILRDALEKAVDKPDYTNPELIIQKLREAIEAADKIKDGLGMEEMLWKAKMQGRREMLEQFEGKDPRGAKEIKDGPSYADTEYFGDLEHFYKENDMIRGRYAKWAISKLKQYMGIE